MLFELSTEHHDMARTVRAAVAAGEDAVAALGLTGLLVPERAGGMGLGSVELAAVLPELGPVTATRACIERLVVAPLLAVAAERVAPGSRLAAILPDLTADHAGWSSAVRRADGRWWARDVDGAAGVVALGEETGLLPTDGWTPDGPSDLAGSSRWWSLTGEIDDPVRLDTATVASVRDHARLAAAALQLGAGGHALDLAVDHARAREQFGRPIGSFQAVKQALASAHIELVMSRPVLWGAAVSVRECAPIASRDVACALLSTVHSARRAARVALQVHGALGYTDECAVGALLNSIEALTDQFGPVSDLRDELDAALTAGETTPLGSVGTGEAA